MPCLHKSLALYSCDSFLAHCLVSAQVLAACTECFPLAVRINPLNPRELYVADVLRGLVLVDTEQETWRVLHAIGFANHLVVSGDGRTVYFSASSSRHRLFTEALDDMIEGQATGQVLAYHTANGQVGRELRLCH
eukprot:TRINITY_DN1006_c0_g1_i14.p1 TRINITY_DN1006_c0_g1~~TRINITY_DN1006_c0_g1_i14.p1  ORF type:complete len:150 (-),score=21.93 TRINITY_DN1006_c0_g1_i14:207-611(-)